MTGPQDPAAAGRDRLQAGHADREQVIETLKDAFVQGRLTRDELDARAGRALAARTCADLAALTADIPPAAGPARPPAPARRRPLARAAARSGICLVIAAAAVRLAFLVDPDGPGPNPYHSWARWCLLIAFSAVMAALGFLVRGVETSWEQRRSRLQLPPPPGPGGHALQADSAAAPAMTRFPRASAPTRPAPTCGFTSHGSAFPRGRPAPRGVRPTPGAV